MLHTLYHTLQQLIGVIKCRLKSCTHADSSDSQSGMAYDSTMATQSEHKACKQWLLSSARVLSMLCVMQKKHYIRHLPQPGCKCGL